MKMTNNKLIDEILRQVAYSIESQKSLRNMTNIQLAQVVEDELFMRTRGGTREHDILSVVIERLLAGSK